MGKVIVFTNVTLDGVMQSPARAEEDTRDAFAHGGWATPFAAMQHSGDALANLGALLFGRWTYVSFSSYFPNQPDNPFSAFLTQIPKYVASTTLAEPLPWSNSTLLKGDAMAAVARLKQEQDKDLVVFGSGGLIQSLMRSHLVDEYVLFIHPLVLGSGRQLFPEGGAFAALHLRDTKTTDKGVVIVTYEPAHDSPVA